MRTISLIVLVILFAGQVLGDCYMHNPRGSNDRLNEANTDRDNANRLFDSQNNAQGGYCYGPSMSFYEGSQLTIEWTNQHGCSNSKLWCNLVIQYMCTDSNAAPQTLIRDGTTTNTIPFSAEGYTALDANNQLLYGMHESFASYSACNTRQRNMGLWISDREAQGGLDQNRQSSIFTRQQNNGDQYGYECPEERDYYPYWAPADWKDIAVLVQTTSVCSFYSQWSQNVATTGTCMKSGALLPPNNAQDCGPAGGVWTPVPPKNISAPDCILAPWTRDNHLGNTLGGVTGNYNWTLPTHSQEPCINNNNCNCVLRIRYNISTGDMNNMKNGVVLQGNNPGTNFIDWKYNADRKSVV